MIGDFKIRAIGSFGDVAAEDDSVLDYFLSTNVVERIRNHSAFLVLGRKGTGKTAIVRYLTEGKTSGQSKSLNLRGYPWNVHSKRIDFGASDIEAYVSSWRYLISVELSSLILSHPLSTTTYHTEQLRTFLSDNYGGSQPKLADILRPKRIKLSKLSFMPAVMGNQLGGIEFDRAGKDYDFGLELNALSSSLLEAVSSSARAIGIDGLSLHFDELDQGLSRIDDERNKMIIGLVIAAREIKREYSESDFKLSPIIYLRSDLWDELSFSDKNKLTQTSALLINWDGEELKKLIDARIRVKLGTSASWEDIAKPDLMRGSQPKWNHILTRTFLRPRDVIQFLNELLDRAIKRDEETTAFENPDIVSSRDLYSNYLKRELDDEIVPHWPFWEEALQAITAIGIPNFERKEFEKEYLLRRTRKNDLNVNEALSQLYRFSVIGYERRSGYGGSSWVFQYTDPAAGWDSVATRFKVHSGLKEYAKLRESRS